MKKLLLMISALLCTGALAFADETADEVVTTEQLPIKVGTYNCTAEIIDPQAGEDVGQNGLPVKVILSSQWASMGLWKVSFSVAEYPKYKVVLREKPADGLLQLCYRNEAGGSQGGIYVPWETSESMLSEVSEDGKTLTGEFDIDALGDDTEILAFFLQNRTGDSFSGIVEGVYLMNEDEEWVPTPGLGTATSIYNTGSTQAVGGSYDDNGNIWDAFVKFNAVNDYLGTYEGTVDEGTYHEVTFYTAEPLPEGMAVMCQNIGYDWNSGNWTFDMVDCQVEGLGTTELKVKIPRSYNSLFVSYYGAAENVPVTVRFTKIVRKVLKGSIATGIDDGAYAAAVTAAERFDAAGARIAQPVKGLNIVRETLSDGTVRTKKVMVR